MILFRQSSERYSLVSDLIINHRAFRCSGMIQVKALLGSRHIGQCLQLVTLVLVCNAGKMAGAKALYLLP